MQRHWSLLISSLVSVLLLAELVVARPQHPAQELAEPEIEVDVIGDVDGTNPAPQKALQDTTWIADWSFDTGAPCSEAGKLRRWRAARSARPKKVMSDSPSRWLNARNRVSGPMGASDSTRSSSCTESCPSSGVGLPS